MKPDELNPLDMEVLVYLFENGATRASDLEKKFQTSLVASSVLMQNKLIKFSPDDKTKLDITLSGRYIAINQRMIDSERKKHIRHNWWVAIVSSVIGAITGGLCGYLVSILTA